MRCFKDLVDNFISDNGVFYVTNCNYNVIGVSLKSCKLLLVEGTTVVDADYVKDNYTRVTVYVLPLSFEFNTKDFYGSSMKLKPDAIKALSKTSVVSFTVNQPIITEIEKLLYLEGPAEDEPRIVTEFKEFINKITDNDIKEELFIANIDVPEFGIKSENELYIVNKHDKSISRMMYFSKFKWKNRKYDSLSIYYFDEDLFQAREHILSKYVLIFDDSIQTNVSLDHNLGVTINNDTVIAVPLKNTKYRDHNMGEVQKLLNRKSIIKR